MFPEIDNESLRAFYQEHWATLKWHSRFLKSVNSQTIFAQFISGNHLSKSRDKLKLMAALDEQIIQYLIKLPLTQDCFTMFQFLKDDLEADKHTCYRYLLHVHVLQDLNLYHAKSIY